MLMLLEHAALGAVLIGAGAVGLARTAVYFQATDTGTDRFFATSLSSVTLVALLVGGLFYLINAVFDADLAWRVPAAIASVAYAVALPMLTWRWIGPRPDATAVRAAS